MKVLKFGGTSIVDPSRLDYLMDIITQGGGEERKYIVFSAISQVTNMLTTAIRLAEQKDEGYKKYIDKISTIHFQYIEKALPVLYQSTVSCLIKQELNQLEVLLEGVSLLGDVSLKIKDKVLSFGERLSTIILYHFFISKKLNIVLLDPTELIITDNSFGKASVLFKQTYRNIRQNDKKYQEFTYLMSPGFVASNTKGDITTLGRGGSDYTASIFAASLDGRILEIWTDVSGMYTTNPKMVRQARPIEELSYEEAMEMSHFGAKVLYPPTIQPVYSKKIPIQLKNTFDSEAKGTTIRAREASNMSSVIGISYIDRIAIITIEGSGLVGKTGMSSRFLKTLSSNDINVTMITQASSEYSICVAVSEDEVDKIKKAINLEFEHEIKDALIKPLLIHKNQVIIALVGDVMKSRQGLSGKMFGTLGRNNINVLAIAQGSSERNISAVISSNDIQKAISSLHEAFFEDEIKQVNLFVTGVGNVGKKFLNQIYTQNDYIRDNFKINLNVLGISNSKKMLFDDGGVNLKNWEKDLLKKGKNASSHSFLQEVKKLNKRNSIFVDNTASAEVSNVYGQYLSNSISIVTCNKIACSSEYSNYLHLKDLARKKLATLLFETNVGAALPIIDTLKNLIASGDMVTEIKAVLSGSLNFVFNNFKSGIKFKDVVIKAKEEGYTEPNPKIDLSGIDVARKMLILVRESGRKINIEDIENVSFLPDSCLLEEEIDAFYESLERENAYFNALLEEANKNKCRLKYVASFKDEKVKVGLEQIPDSHPFYDLEGKDNIVLFYTERYKDQPLIIKGAGAGADVTASGIFADVIRASNFIS